ncbi:MAG: TonB-dependent receptor plug domain-containing protein [Pseudomonadota bacterium]
MSAAWAKAAAAVVGVFVLTTSVAAQSAQEPPVIEEIVVTSEFRQNTVNRTAASVSVIELGDLQGRALNHLEDVLNQIPNVNVAGGSTRARFYQIRGIGERGQFDEPLNSSVGLLIDGVDFSGIGTAAVLHDVAQVEVLRGPQGTLYGANALAGLMHVRTNDPTQQFEAGLTLDAGNFNARGIGLTVSGPFSETVAGRLAIRQYQDDGFHDNVFLDRSDTNERDELSVRGKLSWTPSDRLDLGLSMAYIDIDNGYDAFSLDNDWNTRSDEPGQDAQESALVSLTAYWDVNDAVVLQGTLGHADSAIDYGYDEDWTFVGFDPNEYSSTDRYERDRQTTTIDLRALSSDGGRIFGGSTDWVLGFYGLTQTVDLTRTYTFLPGPFESTFDIDRVALYGELTTALGEKNRITIGLRGERHEAGYTDSEAVEFDPRDDLWGGRFVFERDLNDATMLYLSATRGYKAGGFNASNSLDPELREFDPETLWNYELGLKGRWFNEALTGRFSLFTMQRDDVQIGTSIVRTRPDGSSEFIQLTSNAAEGTNSGFEAELVWAVTERFELFGNFGFLDTEFKDFVNTSNEDLDGEEQAHAPRYQFFVGGEYRHPVGFYARLEVEGKDAFFYSDSRRFSDRPDELRSEPYELVNAALGFERQNWDLRLWGRNLGDEEYRIRGFYFPQDPRDDYTERGWFQFGEPRRYGVTLNLKI